uniref:Major facilitator superfamily (MFS) profile domain-containing protein n=1 Tax=Heliothis virescens TaxID=7102 RepID=A0A2A4JT62_HELVI
MTVKGTKVPFEEALDMTGFSRYNIYTFLLCASIIIGMTFEIFSVSYLVPASSCELGTTSVQQGLVACVPLIGTIAMSHIWGYQADTKGRRKILVFTMTMTYIAGTLAAFSPNWIVLGFLKLMSSAAVSGSYALSVTLLSECTPKAKRSSLVLLTTSVHMAGLGVMAVISIPVLPLTFSYYIPYLDIQFNSWRLLDLIFAVPSAISSIGCYCAFESPKYLASVGKEEEAIKVLKGIYTMNTGKSSDNYQVQSLELDEGHNSGPKSFWGTIVAQTVPMFKAPLLKYTILLSFLFVICYITMNATFVWLPFIINAFMLSVVGGQRSLTICEMIRFTSNSTSIKEIETCTMNTEAMTLVFLITMILAFCNIFMSTVINCIGRKRLFIGIQLFAGLSALILNSSPYWILSAILVVCFLSAVLNFGFLNTYSVDIFPTYVKAMAVCLTVMVGRASAVAGINVLKKLLDTNCEAAFYIFGSVAFGGGLVGFFLPTDQQIQEQKKTLKT